jgi:hypothetical protein
MQYIRGRGNPAPTVPGFFSYADGIMGGYRLVNHPHENEYRLFTLPYSYSLNKIESGNLTPVAAD